MRVTLHARIMRTVEARNMPLRSTAMAVAKVGDVALSMVTLTMARLPKPSTSTAPASATIAAVALSRAS
eukprot:scaffold6161_cov72-Phaeocystis_antarctica.AAC.1